MGGARRAWSRISSLPDGCSLIAAVICLVVVLTGTGTQAASGQFTPQEERGRLLYTTGTSPRGVPVVAYFGKDLLEVPGESATCVSCHGYDGLGRSESGVIPSTITWQQLMKRYGHIHPDGREHGAFSEITLKSYLEDGIYPGGTAGDPSMPVYQIDPRDLDDLIAYLKRLDSHRDPGISDRGIRIGTLLPSGGPAADLADVMQRTLAASFNDVNGSGGIYGRSLILAAEQVRSAAVLPGLLRTTVPEQGVFALVNTFTPGVEAELWRLIEEQHVPLIAPFSLLPIEDHLLHRFRFNLYAGLREQAMALARYATLHQTAENRRIQIVSPLRDGMDGMFASLEAVYRSRGWHNITRVTYPAAAGIPADVLLRIRRDRPDLLLFLGSENDAEALIRQVADQGCGTAIYLPGVLAGKAIYTIPVDCTGRVWLSYPSVPGDRKEWGVNEFRAMAARQQLAVTHPTVQFATYASVKILVEGLRRSGRALSREKLLESLETVFELDTGLTPLVTFTKNRHTGSLGAHIVEVNPQQAGTEGFIVPRGWIPAREPE